MQLFVLLIIKDFGNAFITDLVAGNVKDYGHAFIIDLVDGNIKDYGHV